MVVQSNKVHDVTQQHAIDEISHPTPKNQTQRQHKPRSEGANRNNHTTINTLTAAATPAKNHRCQPPASAKKLKAAPVL